MANSPADVLLEVLHDWGVEALRKRQDEIRFVQMRHKRPPLDGPPVLALTGPPYHDLIWTHTQQDVQLDNDLQDAPVENKGSKRNVPGHTSDVFARSARLPHEDGLRRAADVLNAGSG
jgi:hypothetical protein